MHSIAALFFSFCLCCSLTVNAQTSVAPPEAASAALLDHVFQEVRKWVEGAPTVATTPGMPAIPAATNSAMRDVEFLNTRGQLSNLGAKAWPLIPRYGELLSKATQKQSDLIWFMSGATPNQPASEAHALSLKAKYDNTANPLGERIAALVALGKTAHPSAVDQLAKTTSHSDYIVRMATVIALGNVGKTLPQNAAPLLASLVKDSDRSIRAAAVNSIRLTGREGIALAATELMEYLRLRENPYMACMTLKELPTDTLRKIKTDLEAFVADPKYSNSQKQDAVNILIRIETEAPSNPPRAIG